MSNIAGALAVELFVSILQHPLKGLAPAENDQDNTETISLLGIIPHSIRGFISHYQTVLPATEAFTSCVACSEKVKITFLSFKDKKRKKLFLIFCFRLSENI